MDEFYKNLVKLGFTISEFKILYKDYLVMEVLSSSEIWVSGELSVGGSLHSLVPAIERACMSSTVGNFSIGNMRKVGKRVLISEMHYARLYADASGYYIQMTSEPLNSGYVYAICGVLGSVPWSVVEDMVGSL